MSGQSDFLSRIRGVDFRVWWWLVFGAGAFLRILLFSGYGLGDDPNFFAAYFDIYRSGSYLPTRAYDFRFSFWGPVVGFMRLFGVSEPGFIGFVTFCSILNLALIYRLGRQEWERGTALLAMGLLAIFPLDVLCSTLFVIDIPLSTYCFGAFWLYRESFASGRSAAACRAYAAAAAVFLFFAYLAKEWALLIGILFAVEALKERRVRQSATLVCGGGFAILMAVYACWEWIRFGDPLYRIHLVKSVAIFLPYSREIVVDYPRMMFLANDYGSFFAGFFPHLLFALAVVFAMRVRSAGKWLAFFVLLFAALALAPSDRAGGQWRVLVPHIFRYLCLISIPLCLALAAYLREVFLWKRVAGGLLTGSLVVISLFQCVALSRPTRDAFGEQRRATMLLRQFPDERVWSDYGFESRFANFELRGGQPNRIGWVRSEDAALRWREFLELEEGLLVSGGGRLPWYGCQRCTADLGDFKVPPTWSLVAEIPGTKTAYRAEPLRIWKISRATLTVRQMLRDVLEWNPRLEQLKKASAENRNAVAAELGRAMLESGSGPDRETVYFLTGLACLRDGKPEAASRFFSEGLQKYPDGPRAAEFVYHLALSSSAASDFVKAEEWVRLFRKRFPSLAVAGPLLEIESGLNRAISDYHQGMLQKAQRAFSSLAERADQNPLVRRQARYFLALTLFRASQVEEGKKQSDLYRSAYGEDPSWVELYFREGEALAPGSPSRATVIFSDLVRRFPQSFWVEQVRLRPEMTRPFEDRFHEGFEIYHHGDLERARDIFADLERDSATPAKVRRQAAYMLALAMFRLHDWNPAYRLTERFVGEFPQSQEAIELRFRVAESYQLQGDASKARKAFEELASAFPGSMWAKYARERLPQLAAPTTR